MGERRTGSDNMIKHLAIQLDYDATEPDLVPYKVLEKINELPVKWKGVSAGVRCIAEEEYIVRHT